MKNPISEASKLKLSICIPTFNRGAFIGATLESILSQMTGDCEIVVVDGASTDATETVVSEYMSRWDCVRYFRQETNSGFDRDCDRAVFLAAGEYCWLMTDDDLLKPGAVRAVLAALRIDVSLIVVNTEQRDFSMSKILQSRWLDFESDRVYGPDEMDRLFAEVGDVLTYVGGIIIKRAIWLTRDRQRYYGSSYIYIGVIFQAPLPTESLVIAEPLVCYRRDNAHTYSSKVIELLFQTWPSLVKSLAISESARRSVESAEPWRSPRRLLLLRGAGYYSLGEYRRWIRPQLRSMYQGWLPTFVALIPGALVNAFFVFYYSVTARDRRGLWLHQMRRSRFYMGNWWSVRR